MTKLGIAGLILATTALVGGVALSAGAANATTGAHGAPAIWPHGLRPHTSGTHANQQSTNWSGYAESGANGAFTQARGSWTVPQAQPSAQDLFSSTWVGIDGFASSDSFVIQTGTDQNSGPDGGYDAWYELFPDVSHNLDPAHYPVHPGDVMTASVTKAAGTAWTIQLNDLTANWQPPFSITTSPPGSPPGPGAPGASAEWIEEAPSDNFGVLPLANFGTATFTNVTVNNAAPNPAALQGIDMVDQNNGNVIAQTDPYNSGNNSFSVRYVGASPTPPNPPSPPNPPASRSGYDLVGTDGGVFVFAGGGGSGFYGSLPQLGISVNDVVGMVPSTDDRGYFLVGSDGGVFAFGASGYFGSLPGLGISVNNVRGIVPTSNNQGYFLVGSDGGVFAFGNAPFLGSLPGIGVARNDIIGIAATPSDQGYWVVAASGAVYAFGNAQNFGSAFGTSSAVSGIAATPDGGGYWIVTRNGAVYTFGDANYYGSLPGLGISPARPVIGLVPTADHQGYWLIGSDGGIFAFGDAPFIGSLPSLGVGVGNIVGAVPTS